MTKILLSLGNFQALRGSLLAMRDKGQILYYRVGVLKKALFILKEKIK